MTTDDPLSSIADVICRADKHKGVPFGALTSDNRDTWTHVRIPFRIVPVVKGIDMSTGAPTAG